MANLRHRKKFARRDNVRVASPQKSGTRVTAKNVVFVVVVRCALFFDFSRTFRNAERTKSTNRASESIQRGAIPGEVFTTSRAMSACAQHATTAIVTITVTGEINPKIGKRFRGSVAAGKRRFGGI